MARPETAAEFSCPPYDTVTGEEARAVALGNSHSFMRVVRPEVNLAGAGDPHCDDAYAAARQALEDYVQEGFLLREEAESFYICRQETGGHSQRGVMACCDAEDYDRGNIKRHERTLPAKEQDRARHIAGLRAHTGPVLLVFRDIPAVAALMDADMSRDPIIDFKDESGVRHTIWRSSSAGELAAAFAESPAFYIADGHHRAAAAARCRRDIMKANPSHSGEEEYNRFMTALYPAGEMRVLPYNRCVWDLNGRRPDEFIKAVGERANLAKTTEQVPARAGLVCMYVGGSWYRMELPVNASTHRPADLLDAAALQREILAPLLGVGDPRTDDRIEFVGGSTSPADLARRVDEGRAGVVFSMYPVEVSRILEVADAGGIMPPKSTWFDPKPRSGLLVHTF